MWNRKHTWISVVLGIVLITYGSFLVWKKGESGRTSQMVGSSESREAPSELSKSELGAPGEVTQDRARDGATPRKKSLSRAETKPSGSGFDAEGRPILPPEEVAQGKNCYEVAFVKDESQTLPEGIDRNSLRNRLKLPSDINPSSVCVRMNNRPVRSARVPGGQSWDWVIDPLTSKSAKVSVLYCELGVKCGLDCSIPKDDFMEAIGAPDENDLTSDLEVTADWKSKSKKKVKDIDLKAELAGVFDADDSTSANSKLFSYWKASEEPRASCIGKAQVSKKQKRAPATQ